MSSIAASVGNFLFREVPQTAFSLLSEGVSIGMRNPTISTISTLAAAYLIGDVPATDAIWTWVATRILYVTYRSEPQNLPLPHAQPVRIEINPRQEEVDEELQKAMAKSLVVEGCQQWNRMYALEKKAIEVEPKEEGRPCTLKQEIAEGTECTLMGSEIPLGFGVLVNGDPFDVRYFLKAMLTQKKAVSPYTREALSAEDLQAISHLTGISADEFPKIWAVVEEYMREFFSRSSDLYYAANRRNVLGALPQRQSEARSRGQIDLYNQLTEQIIELLRQIPSAQGLKDSDAEYLKKCRLKELLELAQLKGKITPEFRSKFEEVLN